MPIDLGQVDWLYVASGPITRTACRFRAAIEVIDRKPQVTWWL